MDGKKWYTSKTIWTGVAMAALSVLQYFKIVSEDQVPGILTLLASLGLVSLRLGDRPIK